MYVYIYISISYTQMCKNQYIRHSGSWQDIIPLVIKLASPASVVPGIPKSKRPMWKVHSGHECSITTENPMLNYTWKF